MDVRFFVIISDQYFSPRYQVPGLQALGGGYKSVAKQVLLYQFLLSNRNLLCYADLQECKHKKTGLEINIEFPHTAL